VTDPRTATHGGDAATVAALIADPARAGILVALADGRALPAGELARAAGVAASTAGTHVAKLHAAGLVDVEKHGKHRYYRLAGPRVVAVVEQLAAVAPRTHVTPSRPARAAADLSFARSCYDHLAGSLGVTITARLLAEGTLTMGADGYHVDPSVDGVLRRVGVDPAAVPTRTRRLARPCLDWTARRHHVAGALGAAILASLLDQGWVRRKPGSRALAVTALGTARLEELLGVAPADLAPAT
jgi:DNA-binding transcriptional ArsR family regulator